MYVRSLFLVDLVSIIKRVNKSVLDFMVEYGVKSISDLTNLFISRVIGEMASVYKEVHNALIVFYIRDSERKELLGMRDVINYKKFFTMMEKRMKFPFTTGGLEYQSYCRMLEGDCPEYEELTQGHRSFAEVLPSVIETVRRLKYHKVNRDLIKNEKNLFLCLTSL